MSLILTLGILAGQFFKLQISPSNGLTLLDIASIILCFFSLLKIKFPSKKLPAFFIAILAFSFIGMVSLFLSPVSMSLGEKFISFSYNLRFLLYFLLGYLIFIGVLKITKEEILNIFIFSSLGLAVLGIFQFIFFPNLMFLSTEGWDPHYFRTVSTFFDPNFLGGYLSLGLLIMALKWNFKKHREKAFFVITYLALITTFSRSGAFVFLVSFLVASFLKKSLKLFLLTGILLGGFAIAYFSYHKFVAEPRNINRTQSAEYRLNSYTEGLLMLGHSPFFGVGFNSYRYALKQYSLASQGVIDSHGGSTNDSSLLYIADTTGVLGLVVYIGALIFIIKGAIGLYLKKNIFGIYTLSGLAGILIQSFFINALFYPPILLWISLTAFALEAF